MHIFLLILKILLIVVLSVLGLVIALALLVLLAPVRYKAYAQKQESVLAKVSATWLGFVVCFKASYDDEGLVYRLRLFGGSIIDSEKSGKIDEENEPDIEEAAEESEVQDGAEETEEPGVQGGAEDIEEPEEQDSAEEEEKPEEQHSADETDAPEFYSLDGDDADFYTDESEFEIKPEGVFARLGKKIDAAAKGVSSRIKSISEKLSGLKKKKAGYTKLYNNARTKEAVKVVKKQLIRLLKHLKPTKVRGRVRYGSGDPADTGKHLGYMSVLFPLYGDNIDITPDFEEKVLEGDLFIKGRIRLIKVVRCGLGIIINKNCRITYKRFKKISGGE